MRGDGKLVVTATMKELTPDGEEVYVEVTDRVYPCEVDAWLRDHGARPSGWHFGDPLTGAITHHYHEDAHPEEATA